MGSGSSKNKHEPSKPEATQKPYQGERSDATSQEDSFWYKFKVGQGKRFFDQFPSVDVLRSAQSAFSSLKLQCPTNDGAKAPFPTPSSKNDVFKPAAFRDIDDHAQKAKPDLCFGEIQELVEYLVKPAQNEMGRVRAIFRWVTTRNMNELDFTGDQNQSTAAYYLAKIKAGKGGYPQLFEEMCKQAGLFVSTIKGWVKGVGYEPGDGLDEPSGIWSAVLIDGCWRLLDCHWSARHVVGHKSPGWELMDDGSGANEKPDPKLELTKEYQYQESFFLTDPELMIHSHCPLDEEWQLLARPVSLDEFRDMAYLKPGFLEQGFATEKPPGCVIHAEEGQCCIIITTPKSGTRRFFSRMFRSTKSESSANFGKLSLERFLFLDVSKEEQTIRVRFDLPSTGKYKFELFCEDVEGKPNVFELICAYIVLCDKLGKRKAEPFPHNSRNDWGPGVDTELLGISAVTHKSGFIEPEKGEVEIRFQVKNDMEFHHKLVKGDSDGGKYDDFAFHHIDNDQVIYRVRLPETGKFAFQLYARAAGKEGEEFPNVCSYLIENDQASENSTPFPREITRGKAGPTADLRHFSMQMLGEETAFFVTETGELDLKFKMSQPLEFMVQLNLQKDKGVEDLSDHTKRTVDDDTLTCHLEFPDTGIYHITLLAKDSTGNGGFVPVYHGLIQANLSKAGALPFPKTHTGWKSTYKVLEPEYGYLPTNESVTFVVKIPDAENVTLTGSPNTDLQKNTEGIWEGKLETGNQEREFHLAACFDPGSDKYLPLLTYQIVSPKTIQKMNEQWTGPKSQERVKGNVQKDAEEEKKNENDRKNKEAEQKRKREEDAKKKRDMNKKDEEENQRLEKERIHAKEEERKAKERREKDEEKAASLKKRKDLTDRLIAATNRKDPDALESAINEFKNSGLTEKKGELTEAEITLDIIAIRKELKAAMASKDIEGLKGIIGKIERKNLQKRLQIELDEAREKLKTMERIAKFKCAILNMEAKTMTEIRRYNNPPPVVHGVMKASLLILGEKEDKLDIWKECQKLCNPNGPMGLKRRVQDFDVDKLKPKTAKSAERILSKWDLDAVRQISAGASTFHLWATGMIDEVKQKPDEKKKKQPVAD